MAYKGFHNFGLAFSYPLLPRQISFSHTGQFVSRNHCILLHFSTFIHIMSHSEVFLLYFLHGITLLLSLTIYLHSYLQHSQSKYFFHIAPFYANIIYMSLPLDFELTQDKKSVYLFGYALEPYNRSSLTLTTL